MENKNTNSSHLTNELRAVRANCKEWAAGLSGLEIKVLLHNGRSGSPVSLAERAALVTEAHARRLDTNT